MQSLGERLYHLRTNRNLTQKEVMSTVNIDNLGRYEKNERTPNADALLTLAKFYKVTTDWLLTGEDNITKESNEFELSEDKIELLNYYNQLTIKEKYRLLGNLEERCSEKNNSPITSQNKSKLSSLENLEISIADDIA